MATRSSTPRYWIRHCRCSARGHFRFILKSSINDFDVATVTTTDLPPWPGITIAGAINNLGGDLLISTLPAGNGDIVIEGTIAVQNQQIIAGGSVFIELPAGTAFPVDGEPASKWEDITGGDGLSEANATDIAALLSEVPADAALFGDSIFIDAEYVNINGIIESGRADYDLTIEGSTTEAEIAAINASGATGVIALDSASTDDFIVRYDTANDRIVVEELRVSGGFVDITGHILNTANGEIRALGAYANVNITNDTIYDVVVRRLDVSQRGVGTIVLKDKAKGTSADPQETIYQKSADGVTITSGTSTVAGSDNNQYDPQSGWRYGWSVGQESFVRQNTIISSSSWLGIDNLAPDPDDDSWSAEERIDEPQLMPEGTYYYLDAANTTIYDYATDREEIEEPEIFEIDHWTESSWYGKKTYYSHWVQESRVRDVSTHSIESDRPIDIRFLGHDEADVTINSTSSGRVLIEGPILNSSGTTTITSGTTIEQISDDSTVGGRRIVLTAATGIGTETLALGTDLAADETVTSLEATTTGGAIYLREAVGDLAIDAVSAGGDADVSLAAQGAITVGRATTSTWHEGLVSGGIVRLAAEGGGIGDSDRALLLASGEALRDKVTVTATGDVYLSETTGDLRLEEISTSGNVWLEIQAGDLLDANTSADTDDRTRDELLAGVWSQLQLTVDTGAQDKIDTTLDNFAGTKEAEYRIYWQFRETQADPSVYDAAHLITLSDDEQVWVRGFLYRGSTAQGLSGTALDTFVADAITTLENRRTAQYHTLHTTYGVFGDGLR